MVDFEEVADNLEEIDYGLVMKKVLYSVNILVLQVVLLVVFINVGKQTIGDRVLGFSFLAIPWLLSTHARMNPDYFHYYFSNDFILMKILVVLLFIPALIGIFGQEDLTDNILRIAVMMTLIFVFVPDFIIPRLYNLFDFMWFNANKTINIGPTPGWFIRDALYPLLAVLIGIYGIASI